MSSGDAENSKAKISNSGSAGFQHRKLFFGNLHGHFIPSVEQLKWWIVTHVPRGRDRFDAHLTELGHELVGMLSDAAVIGQPPNRRAITYFSPLSRNRMPRSLGLGSVSISIPLGITKLISEPEPSKVMCTGEVMAMDCFFSFPPKM